jgi:hypothetical protein
VIKGIIYLVLFTILFIGCHKDTTENMPLGCNFIDFQYYNDAKYYLGELSNDYILVSWDTTYSDIEIQKFISSVKDFDQNYRFTTYGKGKLAPLKFSSPRTCEEITGIIFNLQKNPIAASARYTMKTNDCQSMIMVPMGNLCVKSYSNYFYVKVFDENNLADLHKMMTETKTELIEQDQFMKQWFTLKATKHSKGDALKMANYFYESKFFENAAPEILKIPVE